MINRVRKQPTERKKITHHTADRGLIPKIYRELVKLSNSKKNSAVKKWTKEMKGNVNKNHNEVQPNSIENSLRTEINKQVLVRKWGTGTLSHCRGECEPVPPLRTSARRPLRTALTYKLRYIICLSSLDLKRHHRHIQLGINAYLSQKI